MFCDTFLLYNRKVLVWKGLCKPDALLLQSIKNRRWTGLKYKKAITSIIFAKYIFVKKIIHIKKSFILHAQDFGSGHSVRRIFRIFYAEFLCKFFVSNSAHLQSKLRCFDFSMGGVGCIVFLCRRLAFIFLHSPFV